MEAIKGNGFFSTYWPLMAGACITLICGAFYVYAFGMHLSDKQSVWADLGNYLGEPPRDSWRLQLLREWSHEHVEEV
ncbi:hypothetical protein FHW13_000838 [Dokdonella fugitiva]|nr:hypothetical protein [Dokdonella fugitiva]